MDTLRSRQERECRLAHPAQWAARPYGVGMTQRLVIIGAGGFGREVLDVIEAINLDSPSNETPPFEVIGFLADSTPENHLLEPYGVKHIGPISHLAELPEDVRYVIGIGDPAFRRKVDEQFQARSCPVLVHPSVTQGREVQLGPGTIVCSHVSLTNHIKMGRHVHVNINSTVGHDVTLGDYVTMSPLVAISGNVTAEAGAFFGTGCNVNPRLTVGEGAVVGTGAAVVRNVEAWTTVVGVPAKPRS
jgi:sugar O-acyltransferase (sialic acid O-acetyltransferase NeuD family)